MDVEITNFGILHRRLKVVYIFSFKAVRKVIAIFPNVRLQYAKASEWERLHSL